MAENWGSFVLRGDSDKYPPFNDFDDGQLEDYVALTKELDLPNLTQLAVRYPQAAGSLNVRSDVKFHKAMHFYSSWSTPRLRSIFVRNFIPVPFSGARSLVSLRVTLLLDHITGDEDSELDVKSLVSFLLACLGPEKLKLVVHDAKCTSPSLPLAQQRVEMPCVTELDLDFVDCRCAPLKLFFYAVRFPHVTAIQQRIRADEGEEKKGTRFADIFSAVLPNPEAFAPLTDMTLDARTDGFMDKENDEYVHGKITIPFSTMPNLRHLVLTTLSSDVGLIQDGVALPAIRTLVLRDCYQMRKNWIFQFLKQMKAQGDLDLLRVSVDGGSQSLSKCELRGSLSKGEVQMLVG